MGSRRLRGGAYADRRSRGTVSSSPCPNVSHADLPWRATAYRDSGGAGVPIVLLHANTGTSLNWQPQFDAFVAAGYRTIAFDRRGWGESLATPESEPQPGSVAEDLAALTDHLALPPFHLLGVAGGGFVALDYAAWRQHTLRSVTVAASTGSFSEVEMQQLTQNLMFDGFRELPEAFREIGPSFRATEPERVKAWAHARNTPNNPTRSGSRCERQTVCEDRADPA